MSLTYLPTALRRQVVERASSRCEYCLLPIGIAFFSHEVDHLIAEKHVAYINRALEQTFSRYNVGPTRLAIGGFSDGTSYALSLGINNGNLFTHVVAFSPGFLSPASQEASPALFISHSARDEVLPGRVCSRRIVPEIKRAGNDVPYR